MSERQKSQRGFVAVTLITLLAIALVIITYAAILGTFTGEEVTVGGVTGQVWYSTTNVTTGSTWNSTLSVDNASVSWYAKLNTTGGEYTGTVSITWQLQQKVDGTWNNIGTPPTTSYTLTASVDTIYTSDNGGIAGNYDWSTDATAAASYRVVATIESTG